jgi:hypothetical protein
LLLLLRGPCLWADTFSIIIMRSFWLDGLAIENIQLVAIILSAVCLGVAIKS